MTPRSQGSVLLGLGPQTGDVRVVQWRQLVLGPPRRAVDHERLIERRIHLELSNSGTTQFTTRIYHTTILAVTSWWAERVNFEAILIMQRDGLVRIEHQGRALLFLLLFHDPGRQHLREMPLVITALFAGSLRRPRLHVTRVQRLLSRLVVPALDLPVQDCTDDAAGHVPVERRAFLPLALCASPLELRGCSSRRRVLLGHLAAHTDLHGCSWLVAHDALVGGLFAAAVDATRHLISHAGKLGVVGACLGDVTRVLLRSRQLLQRLYLGYLALALDR